MGDLKLVERLQQYTLAPGASKVIRANIKVSSTETGVIFGNIVYEGGGLAERGVVVLADIHIDIMDYIAPAVCADVAFRNMWAEFEWENKVRRGGAVCVCVRRVRGVGMLRAASGCGVLFLCFFSSTAGDHSPTPPQSRPNSAIPPLPRSPSTPPSPT